MIYSLRSAAAAFLLGITTLSPLFAHAATYSAPTLQISSSCVSGTPQISLTWNKPLGATSYSVFRNKSSGGWSNISSRQTGSMYVDKNIANNASYQYQIKASFGWSVVRYSNITTIVSPTCPTSTTQNPITPPQTTGENKITAYITGYGWPDNTPASAAISNGVIHTLAGGTGTYADPITIAVGHSIVNGTDILDYQKGTKFYIPSLQRYFIVEDTCGDGSTPQNGPCHTGYQGLPWLDAWVGGQNSIVKDVYACENKITGTHTVIQNPASNYAVTSGPVFNGTCTPISSETPIKL